MDQDERLLLADANDEPSKEDFEAWMHQFETGIGEYADKMAPTVNLCNILVEDMAWLSDAIRTVGVCQNARRIFVRTAYSHAEGFFWVMKQLAANLDASVFTPPLSDDDIAFLCDHKFYTDPNTGAVTQVAAKIGLKENIKRTKGILRRAAGCETFDIELGSTLAQNFFRGVEVRDRLTHPKIWDKMEVSDDEITAVIKGTIWLNESLAEFMNLRRAAQKVSLENWVTAVFNEAHRHGVDVDIVTAFIKRVRPSYTLGADAENNMAQSPNFVE